MKKKLFALTLAATVVLSFAACGSDSNTSASTGSSAASAASTESSAAVESSSQAEDAMTLADWITSDDAKAAEDATNSALASTGMTVKLAADGNVFVYEYYLPSGSDYSGLTSDDLAAAFDPVIEANQASLDSLFESFETTYGIKLDGARFTFFDADGNELYSGDVENK